MVALAGVERRITVSGYCTRTATPDRAEIRVVAEYQEKDLQEATRKAGLAYERARDQIKRLNLENVDMKTSEYSVNEVREWNKDGKSILNGYRARMGLRVSTSSINKLGEVIAIASRENLRDVGSLRSFLSDEKMRMEQFACLQEAAEHARAKAEKLAASLGAILGAVESVTESFEGGQPPMPMMAMMEADSVGGARNMSPPPVDAGTQKTNVTVQAVFTLN